MNNLLHLGLKIRRLREFRDLSQEYMAQKLQISQAQYSRLENGNREIEKAQLEQIAKLLGMAVKDIENFEVDVKIPVININKDNKHSGCVAMIQNVNHNYQIDPNLEKYYQDYIASLKENISLLKDKIKNLEAEIENGNK